MRFKRLSIHNFRGIADLDIELPQGKPLIVTGDNGSGKTTIYGALEFLLTGENPADDKDASILRNKKDKAWVDAELDNGLPVRRTANPHALEVEGVAKKAGIRGAQQRLCELAGISSAEDASLCLRPDRFLKLGAKPMAELLYTLLRVTVTKDVVTKRLADLEASTNLPILGAFEKAHGRASTNLAACYDSCFAARTAAKRQLKEEKLLLVQFDGDVEGGDAPAFVEAPPEDERKKLETIARKLVVKEKEAADTRKRIADLLTLSNQLQAALRDAPSDDAIHKANATIAQVADELKTLEPVIEEYNRLTKEWEQLDNAGDQCIACNRAWPERKARIAQLDARLDELEEPAFRARELQQKSKITQKWLEDYILNGWDAKRKKLAEVQAELDELHMPDETITAQLQEIDRQIDALRDREKDARAYTHWTEQRAICKEKVEALENRVKALEELVVLFGPMGIRADVLKKAKEPLEEQLNGTLSLWDMSARLTDDLELEVERHGLWRNISSCSAGEKILVALALQTWLANVTGLRLLALDGLEQVDDENRALLMTAVQDLLDSKAVDQAILCGLGLNYPGALNLSGRVAQKAAV